jgi:hypothetical protein
MKTAKGEHKVEFFTNLAYIRQRYEEGAVVAKLLHKELFEAGKITMPYQSFAIYFRREIVGKTSPSTPKKVDNPIPVQQTETREPLILRSTTPKTSFSPHTREIDPKDIL